MVIAETRTSEAPFARSLHLYSSGKKSLWYLAFWTKQVKISEPLLISKQAIHVLLSEPNQDKINGNSLGFMQVPNISDGNLFGKSKKKFQVNGGRWRSAI